MTKGLQFERWVSLGEAATGDMVAAPGTPGAMFQRKDAAPTPTMAADGTLSLQNVGLPQDLKDLMNESNAFLSMSDAALREDVPASIEDPEKFDRHIRAVASHRLYKQFRKYYVVEYLDVPVPENEDNNDDWPWSILNEENDQFEDLLGWYEYLRKHGAKYEAEAHCCYGKPRNISGCVCVTCLLELS